MYNEDYVTKQLEHERLHRREIARELVCAVGSYAWQACKLTGLLTAGVPVTPSERAQRKLCIEQLENCGNDPWEHQC